MVIHSTFEELQIRVPIEGRMKVINPLMSAGPSARVQIVKRVDSEVWIRSPRKVLVGATVHLRMGTEILVGEVRHCGPMDSEHDVDVVVKLS
jgi:hypothetical protein